jgi:hypothetical protein
MRTNVGLVALTGIVLVGTARVAAGQEHPGAFYLGGGAAVVYQDGVSGDTIEVYVTAPGGTTAGWTLSGGVFALRALSVEAEFSSTGVMRAREVSRYGLTYNEERRDRFFGVNVRLHAPPGWRAHLEPVVGFVVVRHEAWSQTESLIAGLPPDQALVIGPRESVPLQASVGLAIGLDARIGGRHVAVVPSFRYHYATVHEDALAFYPPGFPRSTVSAGVSARVDF